MTLFAFVRVFMFIIFFPFLCLLFFFFLPFCYYPTKEIIRKCYLSGIIAVPLTRSSLPYWSFTLVHCDCNKLGVSIVPPLTTLQQTLSSATHHVHTNVHVIRFNALRDLVQKVTVALGPRNQKLISLLYTMLIKHVALGTSTHSYRCCRIMH